MMKTSKFTKGPWTVTDIKVNAGKYRITQWPRGESLSRVVTEQDDIEEKANAHLIASAPKMYELLETLRDEIESQGEHGDQSNLTLINTVLKKARGES